MKNRRKDNEIRAWLALHRKKVKDVAEAAGVPSQTVCSTLSGKRNSRKVLRVLVEWGVPKDSLGLPKDMIREG